MGGCLETRGMSGHFSGRMIQIMSSGETVFVTNSAALKIISPLFCDDK